jgi:LysM repeat protein
MPSHYTVRSGDTLSAIAGRVYHNPAMWPALWWINKAAIGNPDAIEAGQVLKLSQWHPLTAWLAASAMHAIPAPPPPPPPVRTVSYAAPVQDPDQAAPVHRSYHAAPAHPVYQQSSGSSGGSYSGGGYPGGSYGACVVARESGGNSQAMNSSGHYGLYQFSSSTWAEYGGNPADFGNASVSEQNQVFDSAVAAGGSSNWAPYDGC